MHLTCLPSPNEGREEKSLLSIYHEIEEKHCLMAWSNALIQVYLDPLKVLLSPTTCLSTIHRSAQRMGHIIAP